MIGVDVSGRSLGLVRTVMTCFGDTFLVGRGRGVGRGVGLGGVRFRKVCCGRGRGMGTMVFGGRGLRGLGVGRNGSDGLGTMFSRIVFFFGVLVFLEAGVDEAGVSGGSARGGMGAEDAVIP